MRVLTEAEKEEDKTLLMDFFSLPSPPESPPEVSKEKKPTSKPGTKPPEPEINVSAVPRSFRMEKTKGGFSILPAGNDAVPPAQLDIRMAYDIRRKDPLGKYHPADFKVGEWPIVIQSENVDVLKCADNHLRIAVRNAEFHFHVTGFDQNRDLYVKAVKKENTDADSTV